MLKKTHTHKHIIVNTIHLFAIGSESKIIHIIIKSINSYCSAQMYITTCKFEHNIL